MTFESWLLQYEAHLRLVFFMVVFAVVALWEWRKPRRQQQAKRLTRWRNNLGLVAAASLLVRLVLPMGLFSWAIQVHDAGWGLLNHINANAYVEVILALVILDLAIYWQHRVFHNVSFLWRLHRVHHSDAAFDVSTAIRFHPLEILLSVIIKGLLVLILGVPASAILIFEVILNGVALFNHGNIQLPKGLDAILRKVLVTPDMHRVHHSNNPRETNSNYGFNISIWDRVFASYTAQPIKGHDNMVIGLKEFSQVPQHSRFMALLNMPFLANNKHNKTP